MSQIILDMGSGNTCKNSVDYAYRMIDAVAAIDAHKHEVIFKFQLFKDEPPNKPLDHLVFSRAYTHAKELGYKTTSSVFDKESLNFLLNFEIPFVKIACRRRLYWLIGEVPRKVPVYVSWDVRGWEIKEQADVYMACIPKYPSSLKEYENEFAPDSDNGLRIAVSDHSEGLELWNKYEPPIWEKHFILEDDPTNPDCAGHAIKPDLLKEVIGATIN